MLGQDKSAPSLLRRILVRWFGEPFVKSVCDPYRPEKHYMRGANAKRLPPDVGRDMDSKGA